MIECVPADRVETVTDALPSVRDGVPSHDPPSKKATPPVAAEGDTVAVKVTLAPANAGLASAVRVTVLGTSSVIVNVQVSGV